MVLSAHKHSYWHTHRKHSTSCELGWPIQSAAGWYKAMIMCGASPSGDVSQASHREEVIWRLAGAGGDRQLCNRSTHQGLLCLSSPLTLSFGHSCGWMYLGFCCGYHILDWGVFGSSLYLQSVETTITFSSGATAIHLNCVLQPALTNGMANCERLCTPFTYGVLVETVSCLHFTHNHNLNDILLFLPIARIFLLEESMLVYEE